MKRYSIYQFLMLLCLATGSMAADVSDILWLTDVAPKRVKKASEGDHAGHEKSAKHQDNMDAVISGDEGDNLHSGTKRLWLRQGTDPGTAKYVGDLSAEINLIDAKGNRSKIHLAPANGATQAKCEFEDLGFRSAYLSHRSMQDGILRVQLSKAELLKGSCCVKDGDMDPDQRKAISDPTLPLEIIREHHDKEKLFTRITSGDEVAFVVQRLGKPLAGTKVKMLTQQGWQKTAATDENGRVAFTMIRDYFPSWSDFKRRTKETFVVVAEAEAAESGEFQGQPYSKTRYQATLSGRYSPSPYDYKSYAWGLGIAVFVFAFGGLGVYLYRRRRIKPFKEVRFSESTHELA